MKIRTGFVSNSSSSSFIIGIKDKDEKVYEILNELFNSQISKINPEEIEDFGIDPKDVDFDNLIVCEILIDYGCTETLESFCDLTDSKFLVYLGGG